MKMQVYTNTVTKFILKHQVLKISMIKKKPIRTHDEVTFLVAQHFMFQGLIMRL